MTFTHEAGHVVGGWTCGGTLREAHLLPWELPYSTFEPDPLPLVTLWSGPVLGALVPLAGAAAARRQCVRLLSPPGAGPPGPGGRNGA